MEIYTLQGEPHAILEASWAWVHLPEHGRYVTSDAAKAAELEAMGLERTTEQVQAIEQPPELLKVVETDNAPLLAPVAAPKRGRPAKR